MDNEGSTNTWTVVQFLTDDTVDAVPTSWIHDGDFCFWPPFTQDKIKNAIKNCEMNSHWPSHKVRTFKDGTFDDYFVARNKARKAESTSDLNSDIDLKRKRKKKVLSISSGSSDSDDEDRVSPSKLPVPPRKRPTYTDLTPTSSTLQNNNDSQHLLISSGNIGIKETPTLPKCNSACKVCCTRRYPNNIDKTLFMIKDICCDILVKVDAAILRTDREESKIETPILSQVPNVKYPITSETDLKIFEEFFANEEKYLLLVKMFAKIGGANVGEFVKRCLASTISDEIAEKFSYIGRKEKDNFSVLQLSKAVIETKY